MEIKIKHSDIIQATKNLQVVERLPRGTLEQFCRVFKVNEVGNDLGLLIRGFQGKIADIICQQGEGYEDYLQLPRFRVMGHELIERMNLLFRKVWQEYQMLCKKEQINLAKREFQELVPTFENSEENVQFHLGMLQLYRSSSLCPHKSQKEHKKQQQLKQSSNQNNNFINPNPNPNPNVNIQNTMSVMGTVVGQNIFPYFPFPPPNAMAKVQAQQGMNYILENKQNQPLFDMTRFSMQSNYPTQPPIEFYAPIDTKQLFAEKNVDNQQGKRIKSEGLFTQKSSFQINKKFNNYPFVQCVCQGQKGLEDGFFFKCNTCSFLYHYNCLRTEGSVQQVIACPLCLLRKQTIFCQVFKEPLKFSWFFQEHQGQDLKIKLNMLQTEQVFEARKKGYQIQIRFLKIDGKSFKKQKKLLDGYTTEGGILLKQSKHSQVVLPELSQDKKQPISIQIMLKSDYDRDNSAKLYFFAVFITNVKSINDIVKDLFASDNAFSLDYYYQFMGNSDKIQVNLNNNNLIKFPARGANCRHSAVFDLSSFLSFNFDFKKQNLSQLTCSICSQPCQSFKYDSFIYNCIKNFPQYDKKMPQAIQIQRNGDYAWVLQNPPMDPEEQQINKNERQSPQSQRFMIDDPESEQSNQ